MPAQDRVGRICLRGFGKNDDNQLGLATFSDYCRYPTVISQKHNDSCFHPVDAACGYRHSLFLTKDGKIFGCGWNKYYQCGRSVGTGDCITQPEEVQGVEQYTFIQVAASFASSFGVTRDGKVLSWGKASNYILGYKNDDEANFIPREIPFQGHKACVISAGLHHCLLKTTEGKVFSWGLNEDFQLGLGKEVSHSCEPREVHFGNNVAVNNVSAGKNHSLALVTSNRRTLVYGWGRKVSCYGSVDCYTPNELCLVTSKIFKMEERNRQENKIMVTVDITQVEAGGSSNLVLTSCGKVLAFGEGKYGQLGSGKAFDTNIPIIIRQLDRVKQIANGLRSSFAIVNCDSTNYQRLFGFGYNSNYELGLNDQNLRLMPYEIDLKGENCVKLVPGYHHNIVISEVL